MRGQDRAGLQLDMLRRGCNTCSAAAMETGECLFSHPVQRRLGDLRKLQVLGVVGSGSPTKLGATIDDRSCAQQRSVRVDTRWLLLRHTLNVHLGFSSNCSPRWRADNHVSVRLMQYISSWYLSRSCRSTLARNPHSNGQRFTSSRCASWSIPNPCT